MGFGTDWYDPVLDSILGDNHATMWPTSMWAGFFLADPATGGLEVSDDGTGYVRIEVDNDSTNWPDADGGSKPLATDIVWPTSTSSFGLPKWVGFMDAETDGTLVFSTPFTGGPRVAWPDVFTPRIVAGTIRVSYWNLSA